MNAFSSAATIPGRIKAPSFEQVPGQDDGVDICLSDMIQPHHDRIQAAPAFAHPDASPGLIALPGFLTRRLQRFQVLLPVFGQPAQPRAVRPDHPLPAPGRFSLILKSLSARTLSGYFPVCFPLPPNGCFQNRTSLMKSRMIPCTSQLQKLPSWGASSTQTACTSTPAS